MSLQTCPKCGEKYYGTACPQCDFPATPKDPHAERKERLWGLVPLFGGIIIGVAIYTKPPDTALWPVIIAAGIFITAGLATIFKAKGRASHLLGGMICGGLASLGWFAALSSDPVDGGIPLIPSEWNQKLGHFLFGFGAAIATAFALWCFYKSIKPSSPAKNA